MKAELRDRLLSIARFFLHILPIMLFIVLLFRFSIFAYEAYKSFFLPRESRVDVVLEDFDSMELSMNGESCIDPAQPAEFIDIIVRHPFRTDYAVSSSSPISFALSFQSGTVYLEKYETDVTAPITISRVVTDARGIQIWADQLTVDFENPESISLVESICTPALYVDSFGILMKTRAEPGEMDASRIATTQSFSETGQAVVITLQNVEEDDTYYEEMVIRYVSGENSTDSKVFIRGQGEDVNFVLPNAANPQYEQALFSISTGFVQGVVVTNPSGYMTLEHEGITDFLTKERSTSAHYELHLSNDDSSDSSSVIISSRFRGGYSIFGDVTNATYLGNQLISSRWQLLSSDLQAAVVTAALGAIGYLLVKIGPGFYKRYSHFIDRLLGGEAGFEKPDQELVVPPGYLVLVLTSGRALAGVAKESPRWYRRRYVLVDVYLYDGSEWREGPSSVSVEAEQVVYSYLVEGRSEAD